MRQLFCFCLAIVLGFLGAVSPVILPTGLTSHEQRALARKTKLSITPVEQNNSIEVDGIRITIPMLEPFVLPIPKRKPDARTPIPLTVHINNGRKTPLRYSRSFVLIPELVGSNGQSLLPEFTTKVSRKTQPSSCYSIPPEGNLTVQTDAELFWRNNKLQFAKGNYGNRWFFEDLEPGTYQLRLKYFNPDGENSCLDQETQKMEPLQVDELVTPFITLHLIEPVPLSSNAVEIDGVRFETVVSPQVLKIPDNQPDAKTLVRLGLRITNNTSSVFRFKWCCGISPEIIDSNGEKLQDQGFFLGRKPLTESAFPLIFPGKSNEFVVDGMLWWHNNLLNLRGGDGNRGIFWRFLDIKPDTYQIRFTYNNNNKEIELPGFLESHKFTSLWTGEVVTPLVDVDVMSAAN